MGAATPIDRDAIVARVAAATDGPWTVSEGSPVSPVFPTADDLATWMSNPDRGQDWVPGDVALRMVNEGWAPSMVFTPESGVISGVEYIGTTESGAAR